MRCRRGFEFSFIKLEVATTSGKTRTSSESSHSATDTRWLQSQRNSQPSIMGCGLGMMRFFSNKLMVWMECNRILM